MEIQKNNNKRRRNEEEEEDNAAVLLPDLPIVIIHDILSRVPVEDIMRWRCVCRSWRNLPTDPTFIQLQCSRYDVFQSRFFFHRGTNLVMVSKMNGRWGAVKIPIEKDISTCCCNGLIVLHQRGDYYPVIYDPFTKQRGILPPLNLSYTKENFGFGFDQKTNSYKVIFNHPSSPKIITIHGKSWRNTLVSAMKTGSHEFSDRMVISYHPDRICSWAYPWWRELDIYKEKNSSLRARDRMPIFFNGAFHWLVLCQCSSRNTTNLGGLLKLDISSEKFHTVSFSPSLEIDEFHVQPLLFGNSIALVHQKQELSSLEIKIWRILGTHADGSCNYQFKTFKVCITSVPSIHASTLNLLAALSNGDFLFGVSNNLCDDLFVYDQEKDELVPCPVWN